MVPMSSLQADFTVKSLKSLKSLYCKIIYIKTPEKTNTKLQLNKESGNNI